MVISILAQLIVKELTTFVALFICININIGVLQVLRFSKRKLCSFRKLDRIGLMDGSVDHESHTVLFKKALAIILRHNF